MKFKRMPYNELIIHDKWLYFWWLKREINDILANAHLH